MNFYKCMIRIAIKTFLFFPEEGLRKVEEGEEAAIIPTFLSDWGV